MSNVQAIVMKPNDNVATVVEALEAGAVVSLDIDSQKLAVTVIEKIPFGHKFALQNIPAGSQIRKYGEVIGIAIYDITCGQHVHVHNLESCRGRGDK